MKLKVEMVVRVVSPSHSLLVSSFLLLPPSLSFTLSHSSSVALFLSLPFSFSSSPYCVLSLSQHLSLAVIFSQNLSLSTCLYHLRVTWWCWTWQARHWRLGEHEHKKMWSWSWTFDTVNKNIQHYKGEHSTMLPQLLHC
jgi:hypothetical protein